MRSIIINTLDFGPFDRQRTVISSGVDSNVDLQNNILFGNSSSLALLLVNALI